MERVLVHNSRYLHHHGLITRQLKKIYYQQPSRNDWSVATDRKDSVTIAHNNFAKAFDSVSHIKLYYKLKGYGISATRQHAGFLCITAFFNVYNLVPCRPTYHFTPIFIIYCMAAFVNHND